MAIDATPESWHLVVANEFVKKYYSVLVTEPSELFRFYCDLDQDGDITNPTPIPAIYSKILTQCSIDIENVDAQCSFNQGVIISVKGYLSRSKMTERFTQLFFLAPGKEEGRYFILNDILQMSDESDHMLISDEIISKDLPSPIELLSSSETSPFPPIELPCSSKSSASYASATTKKANLHNYRNVPHEQGYSIILKNLPRHATIEMVQKNFKRFGAIRPGGINITTPKHGSFSIGIIEYESRQSVQAAIEEYQRSDRPLDIQVCEKQPKTRVASASCDMDDLTASKFRAFLENFQRRGDKKKYYLSEAMVMMDRGSPLFSVLFSHLQQTDKYLAMDICSCKRLMPVLRSVAVDFVQQILLKGSKSVQLSTDEQAVLDSLDLSFTDIPGRLESLHDFLKNRSLEKVEVHLQNMVLAATPRGCLGFQGILGHIIKNHLTGLSWNGQFELGDIVVCNGDEFIITKTPQRFELVEDIPEETAKAFQADLTQICNCLTYYFSIDGMMPPYFPELFSMLLNIPEYACVSKTMLEIVYEFITHNPATKPPIAVANLFSGIHGGCGAYDDDDTTQFFRTVLQDAEVGWIDDVEEYGNKVLNGVLRYEEERRKKLARHGQIEEIETLPMVSYCDSLESFVQFVRHVFQHGTNKTKEHNSHRWIIKADGSSEPLEKFEPRLQQVRSLDELIMMIAISLGKHVLKVIYELLMNFAMKGMIESVWKDYKRSSYQKSVDDDGCDQ